MRNNRVTDYDDTLVGGYIRQIENPDSVGWNPSNYVWYASDRKGDDPNNMGFGVDIKYNEAALKLTDGRPGRYLTEAEERYLRNKHIDWAKGFLGRMNDTIPNFQPMSPRKEAEAVGLAYRGDGRVLKNATTPLGKAYRSTDENDFHKAVVDYYRSKGLNERARNNNIYWETVNDNVEKAKPVVSKAVESMKKMLSPNGNGWLNKYTSFSEGGSKATPKLWNDLSMAERAEVMRLALQSNIYNLDDIRSTYNEYASGGSIHIKPENRGKFTALKERTGHSATWFKQHGTPAQKKMATFALNARKWKHGDGGELDSIKSFKQSPEVIITPDREYNVYLNTLPDNQRFTPNDRYDSYLYWKLNGKPKNFEEAYRKGMFTFDHSDGGYHANSVAFDDNSGIGYFMKPKDHNTVGYELDWFNKGLVTEEGGFQRPETFFEWRESQPFRDNYDLVNDPNRPNFYMYKPKNRHADGGSLFNVLT